MSYKIYILTIIDKSYNNLPPSVSMVIDWIDIGREFRQSISISCLFFYELEIESTVNSFHTL